MDKVLEEIKSHLRNAPKKTLPLAQVAGAFFARDKRSFRARTGLRFGRFLKQHSEHFLVEGERVTLLPEKAMRTPKTKKIVNQSKPERKAPRRLPKKPSIDVMKFRNILDGKIIDTEEKLEAFSHFWNEQTTPSHVSFACDGVNHSKAGELSILQLAWRDEVAVFDIITLKDKAINLLAKLGIFSKQVLKFTHDARPAYCALKEHYGIEMKGVIDTQLWFELETGKLQQGFFDLLKHVGMKHKTRFLAAREIDQTPEGWQMRPLSEHLLRYARDNVRLLSVAVQKLVFTDLLKLAAASQERLENTFASGKGLRVVIDEKSLQFKSYELAKAFSATSLELRAPVVDNEDLFYLINSLPETLRPQLLTWHVDKLQHLREIILDEGQLPYGVFTHTSPPMEIDLHDEVVTRELLLEISEGLEFGDDNRAALQGKLHRISRKMGRKRVDGLTLRVGRAIENCETLLGDLLQDENRSILFLGVPGSGKTSVIRSTAARIREQGWSVMIVDTSNEIGGDGKLHPMLGRCRRMMVPNINKQADVMVEAVQNHAPQTMVIDEIGRAQEVKAAQTVKTRGVRMIASAHGSFSNLMSNPALKGLLGGFQQVIMPGDGKRKMRTERCGPPVFDTIVEVIGHGHYRIIRDVASAVDQTLEGKQILFEERSASSIEVEDGILPCLNLSFT